MIIYALNIGHLPVRAPAGAASDHVPATGRTIATVAAVMALCVLFWAAYEQIGNAMVLWLRDASDLRVTGGFALKITWFQAVNPFVILVGTPVLLALWAGLARRGREPSTLAQMATGRVLFPGAFLLLATVAALPGAGLGGVWGGEK